MNRCRFALLMFLVALPPVAIGQNCTSPLCDKGGQVFNVKAYGATGNGATDDAPSVAAAVAALPSTGGNLYFPSGTYKLSTLSVARIQITNPGSGYTTDPTISFSGGGGTGAAATARREVNIVKQINVTAGGSGYTSPPTVTIGGPGSGALAHAVVVSGAVASVVIDRFGKNYTSAPTVTLIGGGGSGATAAAVTATNSVVAVRITSFGSGYTSVPTISISGGGGSGAAAQASLAAIALGNGTIADPSTVAAVAVHGPSGGFSSGNGTRLLYAGLSGGTVLRVTGGISGVSIGDLVIDCNATAGEGMNLDTIQESAVESVEIVKCTSAGYGLNVNSDTSSAAGLSGASGNVFTNVLVDSGQLGSKGISVGSSVGQSGDVLQSSFNNVRVYVTGPNAVAANFGFTDYLTFHSPLFWVLGDTTGSAPVQISVPPGLPWAPQAITFEHPAIGGAGLGAGTGYTVVGGPWLAFPGISYSEMHISDSEPLPTLYSIAGFTETWVPFGEAAPLRYSSTTDSAALAPNDTMSHPFNKTYTIKWCNGYLACGINVKGAVVRVRASGVYSTSGTPTLTLYLANAGGVSFGAQTLSTATNAVAKPWLAEGEFIVRTLGAGSNNCQAGPGIFGAGGGTTSITSIAGQKTYNTQADFIVTVFAQWGAANPANSITLQNLDVEVLYPGTTN